MRLGWAIMAGLLLGGGLYFAIGRESPIAQHAGKPATGQAHSPQGPALYRWHDQDGIVHITDAPPPKGLPFERIPVDLGRENRVEVKR
ncbi:protein of unknown function [Pseudoxanthomonas sp. GM95]|uniref:DUF4124 domain-containing protein n=1 Tax=Pseudoxanthomonas sp. GM95 TaxID=1881043 RepID=UPI0008D5361A|nr:DUF4124 domain-containing protein [Pseudoxanthomonas sp. GM95]SEK43948.1 protein of unknown function [Pseudoxanthomonas sp. GM95]